MQDVEYASKTQWLSLGAACRLLEVSDATLRQWADNGYLRVYRTPGGHRRFLREDVESLVNGSHQPAERSRDDAVEGSALRRIRRGLNRHSVAQQPWYQLGGRRRQGADAAVRPPPAHPLVMVLVAPPRVGPETSAARTAGRSPCLGTRIRH